LTKTYKPISNLQAMKIWIHTVKTVWFAEDLVVYKYKEFCHELD